MTPKDTLQTGPKTGPTRREIILYLRAISWGYSTTRAAQHAGRRWPSSFNRLRHKSPEFEEAYRLAIEMGTDRLRDEARRRGVEGWDEPVYQRGELVGYVRKYDSKLLELELKRRDPAYKERGVEITNTTQTLNVAVEDRSASLEDVLAVLQAAGVAGIGGGPPDIEMAPARGLLAAPADSLGEADGVPGP